MAEQNQVPEKQRLDFLIDELFRSVKLAKGDSSKITDSDYVPEALRKQVDLVKKRQNNDPYLHIAADNGCDISIKIKSSPVISELRLMYKQNDSVYQIETKPTSNGATPYFYQVHAEQKGKNAVDRMFRDYQNAKDLLYNLSGGKAVFPSPEKIESSINLVLDFSLTESRIKKIDVEIASETNFMMVLANQNSFTQAIAKREKVKLLEQKRNGLLQELDAERSAYALLK